MRARAIVPSGTTSSKPVKAVPPGETVLPATVVPRGVVLEDDGGVTVDPLTVVGTEVVEVGVVLVPAGVVVLAVCVVLVPAGQSVGECPRTKSADPPSQTTWKETCPPGNGPGPASRKNVWVSPGPTTAVSECPAKVMSVTVTVSESVSELLRMLAWMIT
jgi:hypothetical protein